VPFLLLQTLVENAIKHGIAQHPDGGTIAVSAQTSDTHLRLHVTNPGQVASDAPGRGVGLQNARERLQLLFGERATLSLQNKDANTVEAEVRLPLEESERLRTSPADLPSDLPSSTAG
jgi:LytS/YehU family sensor histidine kinase